MKLLLVRPFYSNSYVFPHSLQTAHATLRRAVGVDANSNVPFHISTCIGHPMIAPYARLLKAVHPHRELFVEPELRGSYLNHTILSLVDCFFPQSK